MNKNDNKILELKKQIEMKKKEINKSFKFVPITNCSIMFNGERYNIHTLNKEHGTYLLIRLNILNISAKDLNIENYSIDGYLLVDWIADIKNKLKLLYIKEEENKLKKLEVKLDKMLSEDKQKELELEDIESMLK